MWRSALGWGAWILALGYAAHALLSLRALFAAPSCLPPARCLRPRLHERAHDLLLFAPGSPPSRLLELKRFDFQQPFSKTITLQIPRKTRNNGTFHVYVGIAGAKKYPLEWEDVRNDGSIEKIPLVVYTPPQAATFNLLKEKTPDGVANNDMKPVAHLKSFVSFSILTDPILIPADALPGELVNYIRITRDDQYYPILQYNYLKSRLQDLVEIKKNSTEMNVTLDYTPGSIGKMKFLVHISLAMKSMLTMGFTSKDIDEVKGIFADTNLYILCATVIISSFHLLFDFLAFKNDVSFWKGKKSMAGLSVRTVLWRAFSQTVVTLYLLDENTSLLILIPSGIAAIIELWKVKKILHIDFDWKERRFPRIVSKDNAINKAEIHTRAVDAEAMKYLSYLLYPLCIIGAIYSLIYQPHKSWYSWTLHSMVNGVYAFGFLFMLPQLFINYKMKSVAALPWRAFMYKAFNTFIDDVFAFIITMPVAHRVACFRDDIVFIIYLYQRWLYPVDKTRVDDSYSIEQTVDEKHEKAE